VGGEDVFADQVVAGGPPFLKGLRVLEIADARDVVDERVEPDVADVIGVERQLNSPREPRFRAADAEVAELLAQETERLVGAEGGLDEFGVGFDVLDQPVPVLAHPEEVVGFDDLGDFAAAVRTLAFDQVLLGEEPFAADAVPAGVFGPVDLVAVVEVLENFADGLLVEGVGGANEAVVGDAEPIPERLEPDDCLVAVRFGVHVARGGGFFHLLAVFVGSGQEKGLVAERTVVTREHVGQHGGVGVADVRLVIDVIDRRGDVKIFGIHRSINSFFEKLREGGRVSVTDCGWGNAENQAPHIR